MITAQQARELSASTPDSSFEMQQEEIERLIREAIAKRPMIRSITLSYTLGGSMRNCLEDAGFKVGYGSKYNEQFTSISW